MGGVVICCLSPHPPIIVPEVGGRETRKVEKTIAGMRAMSREVKQAEPETLVLITPHGAVRRDFVTIDGAAQLEGGLAAFGAPEVRFSVSSDLEMVAEIEAQARAGGVPVARVAGRAVPGRPGGTLDHGVVVPLYFLREAGVEARVVLVAMSFLAFPVLYEFGRAVQRAAESRDRRTVVVASGDLSHRLIPGAPAGYDPRGQSFDQQVVEALREGDAQRLMALDPVLIEAAGECGLRPAIMAMGAVDGMEVDADVLSYEGPFGVGYCVALLRPSRRSAARVSPFVALARQAVETYVREGKRLKVVAVPDPEMAGRAGVFVSIKKHGKLRGCIGTVAPTQNNIAEEIVANAISASTRDPRFPAIRPEELGELVYWVDVLSEPEPVAGMEELEPRRYGVIVRCGPRAGLLLPDLEGVDTPQQQVEIAREKAGIGRDEPVELFRFEVKRHT